VVLAYLGTDILRRFGAEILVVNLISFAVLREFAVLLTAIMVAGRSGSAFTAQLGSMKMREEVDAMRALGLDPIELLVVPRVLALVIVVPLLTVIAMLMGFAGGMLISIFTMDMSPALFLTRLEQVTHIQHFWVGMIKAPFFAFLIALVGCYQGLKVGGSAESLGKHTTTSVVESIFIVIVLDALFAIFFITIDY
jgi:phospholipid/cholesterol/gamma-HCH transport system permease protein